VSDYICAPPAERVIPVTRGCDRSFTIQRLNSGGTAVNFDAGSSVYMWIDVDRVAPTKVDAAVSGSNAAFTLDYTLCDLVKTGTRWRVVLKIGSSELPLLVGKFERYDG
jgi:hypothetical protein